MNKLLNNEKHELIDLLDQAQYTGLITYKHIDSLTTESSYFTINKGNYFVKVRLSDHGEHYSHPRINIYIFEDQDSVNKYLNFFTENDDVDSFNSAIKRIHRYIYGT
ncbi:hypothetical protein HPQ32_09810 [Photobacterium carnosum]|uniref:hypothetical protein n=1 Tax=Photobacterium carnosum TaxID=2023717 RepID=UPI001C914170|nr:hypothetical protein [Photobacterium carnosum]MBY3788731.1 hypothetical protein [Photobacterium carnosum]MCD9533875.1 hypothetical protein [Photobacterium carnosum]